MLNILKQQKCERDVGVPICGRNTLDVVYAQIISAERFKKIYDNSNYEQTAMEINLISLKKKPIYECYYSFRSADYDASQEHIRTHPFQPMCHTYVVMMNIEYMSTIIVL